MTASTNEEFIRIAFTLWFDKLAIRFLGGGRENLALSDADASFMIVRVIHEGALHRDAAQGVCSEAELQERHQEYVRNDALRQFLANWPEIKQALREPPSVM